MNRQVAANVCLVYPQVRGLVARVRRDSLIRAARRKSSSYPSPRGVSPREPPNQNRQGQNTRNQNQNPKAKTPEIKSKASKLKHPPGNPAGAQCRALPRQGCGRREVSEISAGGVQPAHRGTIGRVPERLQLVVPRLGPQPRQVLLQRGA